jgi:N-acetylglucosaminyldiphosphoundecaprenol N-acetyl-beta-D-mannosaminyltransferase
MTALIHYPERDCVSSLGIPVDNLTLDEAVDRIVAMARKRDGRARLVSTLNVDFLVNSLGTRFRRARHPELLDVLRNADLVTADGFPILWLSRIVGRPLRQRVCGSDLVPALADRASREGLSLFLFGGAEGVARDAARRLQMLNPGLRIAGTAAPFVHTEGPGMVTGVADDAGMVERINASGADILLVGLGNPKQELWFNRNRHRLRVPVSIGVGGTFEFITGAVRRAPDWIQRLNLEWAFRITQDPMRLWRRYAVGLFKLSLLSAPLVQSRLAEKLAFAGRAPAEPDSLRWRTVWSNRDNALAVLRLPSLVSRDYLNSLVCSLVARRGNRALHLLDFSGVRKVEMAGHPLLLSLAELQRSEDMLLRCLAIPGRLRRDLAVARVLDVLGDGQGGTLDALGGGSTARVEPFSCRSYALEDASLIFLAGRVNGESLTRTGFGETLRHAVRHRDCIVDLRGVGLLDSAAIVALSPFFNSAANGSGRVLFSGLTAEVRQMLRVAGLGEPRHVLGDADLLAVICAEGGNDG